MKKWVKDLMQTVEVLRGELKEVLSNKRCREGGSGGDVGSFKHVRVHPMVMAETVLRKMIGKGDAVFRSEQQKQGV